jgi:hypothetical protein
LGVLNSVNINGDSWDIYHNIFLDPMFVNPDSDDFNLQWNSPCIDAGDPESPLDPDSTIADIGAFYYDQTQGVENPIFSLSTLAFSLITYPNPFNADSQIRFSLPEASLVELKIYDVLGREIAILVDQTLAPGMHTVIFHGENLSSGIYFCSLRANNYHTIKKLILVK